MHSAYSWDIFAYIFFERFHAELLKIQATKEPLLTVKANKLTAADSFVPLANETGRNSADSSFSFF
jgi:hypothetical protein